jgi:hypothetical protein
MRYRYQYNYVEKVPVPADGKLQYNFNKRSYEDLDIQ